LENVEQVIRKVFALQNNFHILIVDDNSPDGTSGVVQGLQQEFPGLFLEIRKEKDGLGKAYTHGFRWALNKHYNYIFEMDADLSHSPEGLPRELASLKGGNGVASGSRYSHGVNVVNWPRARVLLAFFGSKYAR